jgi:S-adenosylmethionine decarboxylase
MESGSVWIVDAYECDAELLRSAAALERVFAELVADLGLHPVREIVWHRFPAPGGVTGFQLLSESHVSCHTYPEHRFAAFDLYCCRPRREWPWSERLAAILGAERVSARCLARGGELAPARERVSRRAVETPRRGSAT